MLSEYFAIQIELGWVSLGRTSTELIILHTCAVCLEGPPNGAHATNSDLLAPHID